MTEHVSGVFLADVTLAQRLEMADAHVGLASAEIHAKLHPESGSLAEPLAGGYAVYVGPDSPLSQALGIGMQGQVTRRQLERLELFFRKRGAPVRLELCPLADPSLLALLADRPYKVKEFSNMMVRKLRVGQTLSNESTIKVQVCVPDEAEFWARTVAKGFGDEIALTEENLGSLASLVHAPEARCVLAWFEGKPVGGGAMSVHEGVAALYGASTLSGYRRLGVQTTVLRSLIAYAMEVECDLAYTLTKPGSISQRNLERQGFHVAYTRAMMVYEPQER